MRFHHKKDGGSLELNWANAYGVSRTCNVCMKIFVLPTENQLKTHPDLISEFRGVERLK